MALAEIYGKTPFIYFEDLLTADVFAAFRYLPPDIGIISFLRSIPGLESLIEKPNASSTCSFHFWLVGKVIGREPDVLLEVEINGRLLHIVIEAKYYSGPGDNLFDLRDRQTVMNNIITPLAQDPTQPLSLTTPSYSPAGIRNKKQTI